MSVSGDEQRGLKRARTARTCGASVAGRLIGRTADSDSVNRGSSPRPPATLFGNVLAWLRATRSVRANAYSCAVRRALDGWQSGQMRRVASALGAYVPRGFESLSVRVKSHSAGLINRKPVVVTTGTRAAQVGSHYFAGVAQSVELAVANVEVAGSNPATRFSFRAACGAFFSAAKSSKSVSFG